MKITKEFLEILKNFSTISQEMFFAEGKIQSTTSTTKTILALAQTNVDIPRTFSTANLPKLLSLLSIIEDPDLDFTPEGLTIKGVNKEIFFRGVNPEHIVYDNNPGRTKSFTPKISFTMGKDDFSSLSKISAILAVGEILFSGDGKNITMTVAGENWKNHHGKIILAESDEIFKAYINIDKMKFLSRDYSVGISSKGSIRFQSDDITYFCAINRDKSEI